MIKVVLVNGRPSVGKSEFEKLCEKQCNIFTRTEGFIKGRNLLIDISSTIDLIKDIATQCGWDGTKTPKNRKFLSDLKDLLTQWNDVSLKYIVSTISKLSSRYDWIVFVDCREPQEIQRMKEKFNATTLLIRRESVENSEPSNHADANVFNYNYDLTIWNNSDIASLEHEAKKFIEYMKREEVPHYEFGND